MIDKRFYGYKHWTLEDVPRCFNVGKGVTNRSHSKCGRNHKWHAIVKRYGIRVEVCFGPETNEDACVWEIEWIAKEHTFSTCHDHDNPDDIGCNFTTGGEGVTGYVWTTQHRENHSASLIGRSKPPRTKLHSQRLALANLGRKDTDETRTKKSISGKKRHARPGEKEKHLAACNTETAKARLRAAAKRQSAESRDRIRAAQSMRVAQYDVDDNLIAIYPSAKSAAYAVNGSQGNISRAARSDYLKSMGFRWKYL